MKTLATLIRLQKQKLDVLRRRLGVLQNQRARQVAKDESLVAERERELQLAGKTPEMGGFFGNFAKRIRQRREEIAAEIVRIDEQINATTDQVRDVFGEMKKYEIALENRRKAETLERHRKDVSRLDEAAARMHRKQVEGE